MPATTVRSSKSVSVATPRTAHISLFDVSKCCWSLVIFALATAAFVMSILALNREQKANHMQCVSRCMDASNMNFDDKYTGTYSLSGCEGIAVSMNFPVFQLNNNLAGQPMCLLYKDEAAFLDPHNWHPLDDPNYLPGSCTICHIPANFVL